VSREWREGTRPFQTLVGRWFVGSFVGSLVRSLVRWFVGSFVGSLVRWFVGSLVGSLVRWFVVGWLVGSWVRNAKLTHRQQTQAPVADAVASRARTHGLLLYLVAHGARSPRTRNGERGSGRIVLLGMKGKKECDPAFERLLCCTTQLSAWYSGACRRISELEVVFDTTPACGNPVVAEGLLCLIVAKNTRLENTNRAKNSRDKSQSCQWRAGSLRPVAPTVTSSRWTMAYDIGSIAEAFPSWQELLQFTSDAAALFHHQSFGDGSAHEHDNLETVVHAESAAQDDAAQKDPVHEGALHQVNDTSQFTLKKVHGSELDPTKDTVQPVKVDLKAANQAHAPGQCKLELEVAKHQAEVTLSAVQDTESCALSAQPHHHVEHAGVRTVPERTNEGPPIDQECTLVAPPQTAVCQSGGFPCEDEIKAGTGGVLQHEQELHDENREDGFEPVVEEVAAGGDDDDVHEIMPRALSVELDAVSDDKVPAVLENAEKTTNVLQQRRPQPTATASFTVFTEDDDSGSASSEHAKRPANHYGNGTSALQPRAINTNAHQARVPSKMSKQGKRVHKRAGTPFVRNHGVTDVYVQLTKLQTLFTKGFLNKEEYSLRKGQLIDKITGTSSERNQLPAPKATIPGSTQSSPRDGVIQAAPSEA